MTLWFQPFESSSKVKKLKGLSPIQRLSQHVQSYFILSQTSGYEKFMSFVLNNHPHCFAPTTCHVK